MDVSGHIQRLATDGYTILDRLISEDFADELLADVVRLETEFGSVPANNRFEGSNTTRTYNLLARGSIWQQVPAQPQVLRLVESVLGDGCLVSSIASISLRPGETAQVIHADDQAQPLAKPHVQTVCNSMWALTDFTEENGATRVAPGSQNWDSPDYFVGEPDVATVAAVMAKGSVLVWQGSTWHGGGANTSVDQVRVGVAMNYCAGFIRQQENQQLGIPHDVMATFTPELRQLCGLGMYRGLTGNIDKRSPAEVLYGDPPEIQLWDSEQT